VRPHGGLGGVFGMEHKNGFFFQFKVSGGGGRSLSDDSATHTI
jgi:hypothetical protein